MKEVSVNFPNAILDRFNVEGIIISPAESTLGWVLLSDSCNNDFILRVHLIERMSESLPFELNSELAAFKFTTYVEMKKFYTQLINMSALEYMSLVDENTAYNIH